eukprot:s4195_g6.t1
MRPRRKPKTWQTLACDLYCLDYPPKVVLVLNDLKYWCTFIRRYAHALLASLAFLPHPPEARIQRLPATMTLESQAFRFFCPHTQRSDAIRSLFRP